MSEIRSEKIKILLAIQQEFLCNGIKAIFSPFDDIEIVGELNNFEYLTDSIKTQTPEILIISAIETSSFISDLIKTTKLSYPEVSVIMMLENYEDDLVYTALGLGVSACLATGVNSDELITCIKKVWHGENPIFETLVRPGIARFILKDIETNLKDDSIDVTDTRKTLSESEREILHLVANGYTLDQIISNINSSENDIIQHLTSIYGKLIFNNFLEFSVHPSENPITHDHSIDVNIVEDNVNTQTIDIDTPGADSESEVDSSPDDIHGGHTTSEWEGFEALKNELQETLERLAPFDNNPVYSPEDKYEKYTGTIEHDSTNIEDRDGSLSEVITEPHNLRVDEIDMTYDSGTTIPDTEKVYEESSRIDGEDTKKIDNIDESTPDIITVPHKQQVNNSEMINQKENSQSSNTPEKEQSVNEDKIQNSESAINESVVNNAGEFGNLSQDTFAITSELEEKEDIGPVKQKSRWFKFSLKRDHKTGSKNNKSSQNDDREEDTVVSGQPEISLGEGSDVTNVEKKITNRIQTDNRYTSQTGHRYSREEILSSVKGLGVPVFVKTPVDGKQLEKLESIIKTISNLNIILHKGTAQEHVLVISGQDPADLIKILGDIPLVESTSDENGIINIKLLSITGMDDFS